MVKISTESMNCGACESPSLVGLCEECCMDLMTADYLKITTFTGFQFWYIVGRDFDFTAGL